MKEGCYVVFKKTTCLVQKGKFSFWLASVLRWGKLFGQGWESPPRGGISPRGGNFPHVLGNNIVRIYIEPV